MRTGQFLQWLALVVTVARLEQLLAFVLARVLGVAHVVLKGRWHVQAVLAAPIILKEPGSRDHGRVWSIEIHTEHKGLASLREPINGIEAHLSQNASRRVLGRQ